MFPRLKHLKPWGDRGVERWGLVDNQGSHASQLSRQGAASPVRRWGVMLGLAMLISTFPLDGSWAHQVKTAADVGATLHIEPDDVAIAGQPNAVWFILSERGGAAVPLADCQCVLTVYNQAGAVVQQPQLVARSVEGGDDRPSAEILFPSVGLYTLELKGSPQAGAEFKAFEFRFEVTVASGSTVNDSAVPEATTPSADASSGAESTPDAMTTALPSPTAEPEVSESLTYPIVLGIVVLLVIGGAGTWVYRVRRAQADHGDPPPSA